MQPVSPEDILHQSSKPFAFLLHIGDLAIGFINRGIYSLLSLHQILSQNISREFTIFDGQEYLSPTH